MARVRIAANVFVFYFPRMLSALAYTVLFPSKVLTGRCLRAHREAAGQEEYIMSPIVQRPAPEALGSSVDESVTYIHPETNEIIVFTVTGFGKSKSKGRFTVIYLDVEVELGEQEVSKRLIMRVEIEE